MNKEHTEYLKWIIGELNGALDRNPFTANLHVPIKFEDIAGPDGKIVQADRLLIAAEIYKWVTGGKWRLLDLEHIIRGQRPEEEFGKREIKLDIKDLIDKQILRNDKVLKMCLLLTGIKESIIDDAKFVIQKRAFNTGNPSKLWSSIGYYDMKDKSIHVSTGAKIGGEKYVYPVESIIETSAHELGHHIYISMLTKRYKTPKGTVAKIRKIIKSVKSCPSDKEHKQWTAFYRKDYSKDWDRNKALHVIPKEVYVRYGIESEIFAQSVSGKTTISKAKRKALIGLINKADIG